MLTIIAYHHVNPQTVRTKHQKLHVSAKQFAEHMGLLKSLRLPVISLSQALTRTDEYINRGHYVALTFDDGYDSFREHAWPILLEYGFPVTVFIVSSFIGRSLPDAEGTRRRYLNSAALHELCRNELFTLGAHSTTHPNLTEVTRLQCDDEVTLCKRDLEDEFKVPVEHFCYPFGAINTEVVSSVVRAGYRSACTTSSGHNGEGTDAFLLRRVAASQSYEDDRHPEWSPSVNRLRLKLQRDMD